MLAIPIDESTTKARPKKEHDHLVDLVHKIACKLGLLNTVITPPEYMPSHDYRTGVEDLKRILFREAGIAVDSSTGTWDVRAAFSGEKFDEKTRAFWEIVDGFGEWGTLGQHLVPLMSVMLKRKDKQGFRKIVDIMNVLLAPLVREDDTKGTGYPSQLTCLLHHQRTYKRYLLDVIPLLRRVLLGSLEDFAMTKAVLQLIHSLLSIPDQARGVEANTRYSDNAQLIRAMESSGLIEYLMTAISSLSTTRLGVGEDSDEDDDDDEQTPSAMFAKLICELLELLSAIFPMMLGDLEGERPFFSTATRKTTLQQLRGAERRDGRPVRHARFTGSIVVHLSNGQDYLVNSSSRLINKAIEFDTKANKQWHKRLGEVRRLLLLFVLFRTQSWDWDAGLFPHQT